MQVVDQREDSSMLHHELDECHSFTTKQLFEIDIEDLNEGGQDNIYLIWSECF